MTEFQNAPEQHRRRLIQDLPASTLERSIMLASQSLEKSDQALVLLKTGDIDRYISAVTDPREQEARRQTATSLLSGIEGHIDTLDKTASTARLIRDTQKSIISHRLAMLLQEWQLRVEERDEVDAQINRLEQEYVASGLIASDNLVLLKLRAAFDERYPKRRIVQVLDDSPESPDSSSDADNKANQDNHEPKSALLPIAFSRLKALQLFVERTQFDETGELAMRDEEIVQLAGKAKATSKDKVITGDLARVMEMIPLGRKSKQAFMTTRHTQLALTSALNRLAEKASWEQLLPEEAQIVQLLQTYTHLLDETQAIAAIREVQRRVNVLFESVKVKKNQSDAVPNTPDVNRQSTESIDEMRPEEAMTIMLSGRPVEYTFRDPETMESIYLALVTLAGEVGKQVRTRVEGNVFQIRLEVIE